MIFNGIELDPSLGGGSFVFNGADAFGTGNVDALMFGTVIEKNVTHNGSTGDKLFIAALSGLPTTWDTLSLPTDYSFLSQLTTRFSAVSLEVPFGDDENDIRLGQGSFEVTAVPEPAT